jgi:tryptophanyl-tRNA synthetase
MIEQTNDLVRNFNRIYKCAVFSECKALVPTGGLIPGIDGASKMSKSLGNAVYLSDDEKAVAQKIKMMFTDPKHLRVEDPGTVEGNVVFSYLDAFDPDIARVEEMKAHYRRGGLGDGVVKQRLRDVLEEMLKPIRARRAEFAADRGEVMRMLKAGTERAREVVCQTLREAKSAMGINYF